MPTPSRSPRSESGPLLFVLGLTTGLVVSLFAERLARALGDADLELVRQVRNLALDEFVQEVEPRELVDDALRGMLGGLDRYSRFYGPEEVAHVNRETTGEFRGIGVVFRQPPTDGQVLFAFPGSPAAAAGIGVGDRLIEVAGRVVAELAPGELQETIQADREGPLAMLVESLDGERRRVQLEPEPVVDPTVRHARIVEPELGIGYLSILSFTQRTPEEFDTAVRELLDHDMQRLVVDLRFNPGGILDAAVHVANRFIAEGTIVETRTRTSAEVTRADPAEAKLRELPVALLIDEGSASASEVLAGALQDHGIAALIGEASYGKGTVQTLRQLREARGIVKLTTATYYTPSGRGIERHENGEAPSGISPDHLVEIDDEERLGLHAFLQAYSPPLSALPEIEAWERSSGAELFPRHPRDHQLDVAVALLSETASRFDAHRAF